MIERISSSSSSSKTFLLLLLLLLQWRTNTNGQQEYVNNKQLACEVNSTNTLGFVCNGASSSCLSYLTFRSDAIYNSPAIIGYALNVDPIQIARLNNVSDVGPPLPSNTLLIVPVNCSCFSSSYYQHNASYVLKYSSDTYFSIANITYQGLTTCQALMTQNPNYYFRDLKIGMEISIPLRCACPTKNQTHAGINYLVSYLVASRNDVSTIAAAFGGIDEQSILDANEMAADALIFPFTTLLVPLKSVPTKIDTSANSPPAPFPPPPPPPPTSLGKSSKKWLIIGVGVGGAAMVVLMAIASVLLIIRRRHRRRMKEKPDPSIVKQMDKGEMSQAYTPIMSDSKSWSISAEGIRQATGVGSSSLAVYKFEELQKATGFFSEENRIKGSVFLGRFDGDLAAVKVVNGEVSTAEINILQQLNHSHIIRLSGFCLHEADAYLVYEYAENGSLNDLLHEPVLDSTRMNWKQRVQIAYDVADALNYLHNYSKPTCIHKNLKSSNILLDSNFRAKITNFGLARSIAMENHQSPAMQITRHVVGTHGYMAPEYIENGLITPQLDVFAFGVVILELLSGREALEVTDKIVGGEEKEKERGLLYARISKVLGGENVRENLQGFVDPTLKKEEYPLEIVFSLAQLALNCVAHNPNSRPSMADAQIILSKILSSSLDWDPLDQSGSSDY